jgi:hypothetical protein
MNRFDEWFDNQYQVEQERILKEWGVECEWDELNIEDKEDIYYSETGEMTPEEQESKYWDDKIDEARLEGR